MAADKDFRVRLATDGSAHAKAALATAVRFPWPERTRVRGITLVPRRDGIPTGIDESPNRYIARIAQTAANLL